MEKDKIGKKDMKEEKFEAKKNKKQMGKQPDK